MRFAGPIAIAVMLLAAPAARAGCPGGHRCGPAADPEAHRDYGGTPDAMMSEDLGLSAAEIEAIFERLASPELGERVEAAVELKRDAAGSEDALREALWSNHGARNAEMKDAMRAARRRLEAAGDDADGGLLGELIEMDPTDPEDGDGVRGATRVMAALVALASLDTMAGYKVMLDFSGRHAGVFRHEIGAMLVSAGLDALPALVYGRGSEDEELHMFSVKWIRDLGNPLLGEQVRGIDNPRRLAQLLEAYASVNELDAVEVTLSLTNHDSVFVRRAARACLEVYGSNAKWAIRRQYENTFSREPPDGTDFAAWREALYDHYDAERIAPAMGRFEEGLALHREGRLAEMAERFEQVLEDAPVFPRRHAMAAGFLDWAAALEEDDRRDDARRATLLALRVAEDGSTEARRAEARLRWLEAEAARAGGALDVGLYREVLELDPDLDRAREWASAGDPDRSRDGERLRKALIVSGVIFVSALLVAFRLRAFPSVTPTDGDVGKPTDGDVGPADRDEPAREDDAARWQDSC